MSVISLMVANWMTIFTNCLVGCSSFFRTEAEPAISAKVKCECRCCSDEYNEERYRQAHMALMGNLISVQNRLNSDKPARMRTIVQKMKWNRNLTD